VVLVTVVVLNPLKVALSKLSRTIFAVFALQIDDLIAYEPQEITAFLTHDGSKPVRAHQGCVMGQIR